MKNDTLDDYLDCSEYLGHPIGEDGFSKFFREENGEYYFAYLEQGKVIFRSEGYTSEAGRDNGIKSVKKNESIEKRYKLLDMGNGKWGLSLRAGNHQEIAITCPVDSTGAAWSLLPDKRAEFLSSLSTDTSNSNNNIDEYLSCESYKGHQRTEAHSEFSTFEQEGEYYFALLDAEGNVLLRSEGYTSEAGRDNGINSVSKNRIIEKRYKVVEEDGKHYVILKAGNHQEIGRSCAYDSAAAANTGILSALNASTSTNDDREVDDYLPCDAYKGHERSESDPDFCTFEQEGEYYFAMLDTEGGVVLRSEGYTTSKARDNGIASVTKNREIEKRYKVVEEDGKHFLTLKAGNHQEIGRGCPFDSAAAASATMFAWKAKEVVEPVKTSNAKDDDYLKCEDYKGHQRSIAYPEFSTFEKDGLHYFAMLDDDNNILLRSEGYTTVASRNNGIRSVIKNKDIEKRRSVLEKYGYYFVVLKAGNHQEIGRSCSMKDEASALALFAPAVLAATPVVPPAPEPPADKEDDYLSCDAYKGHDVNDKKNNVAFFKKDDQLYFVLYDADGDVKLRSEGFRTAQERDQELSGVLRFHDNPDMYERIQKGKYFMDVLKDETGREVGRSCLQTEKKVVVPPVVPVAAAAAAIVTSPTTPPPPPPPPPPPKPEPEVAAPVAAAGGSGCMRWWWLLPLLLLLLVLLWFLFKGCAGCGAAVPVVPPVVDDTTEVNVAPPVVPVDTVEAKPDPKPAPKPAPAPKAADISLESVYYDYNSYELRAETISELDKMVRILNDNPTYKGLFLGHTDTRGSQNLNDRLSRKRAQAALNYVNEQGIAKSRLSWENSSENAPKAQNDVESEQKLQLNRRVDLIIKDGGKVVEDTEKDVPEM